MDVWVLWDDPDKGGSSILCKDCAIKLGIFNDYGRPDVSIADALPGDRCDQCYASLWGKANR